MSGLYFDIRRRFPWREQLRLFGRIAFVIAGVIALGLAVHLPSLIGAAPHLSLLQWARGALACSAVIVIPAVGIPGLGLLLTIALWPWGRRYLARE